MSNAPILLTMKHIFTAITKGNNLNMKNKNASKSNVIDTIEEVQQLRYAGVTWRLFAFLADLMLLVCFMLVVVVPLLQSLNIVLPVVDYTEHDFSTREGMSRIYGLVLQLIFGVLGIGFGIVGWLYTAGMEASPAQASIGKLLLGLKVSNTRGERLSFLQATARYFLKLISIASLGIGFFIALFNKKKQMLHDTLSNCVILMR